VFDHHTGAILLTDEALNGRVDDLADAVELLERAFEPFFTTKPLARATPRMLRSAPAFWAQTWR
jgi:hypothetical protein